MIEIQGQYNTALCYCDTMDDSARQQIQDMCDQRLFAASRIRIMPDVHAGKGCTIGTAMTVTDKVAPSLVGVDIGCDMETVQLAEKEIDFDRLDKAIRRSIPAGVHVRETPHSLTKLIDLDELRCAGAVDRERALLSLGTLGGGNHFIELDRDEEGFLYLVVHSGSRNLGAQTAQYYRRLGWQTMNRVSDESRRDLIERYKAEGRAREIENALRELEESFKVSSDVPEKFAYVEGQNLEDYLHDMMLVQLFASLNREAVTRTIIGSMGLTELDRFTTIHNYIDVERGILRKGAVSAQKGERRSVFPLCADSLPVQPEHELGAVERTVLYLSASDHLHY